MSKINWKMVRPGDFPGVRYGSTKIDAHVTLGEASKLLAEFGAHRFEQIFDGGFPVGIRFSFPLGENAFPVTMRAPINPVADQLRDTDRKRVAAVPNRRDPMPEEELYRHAVRVAWRRLYYLLEQVLLLAEDKDFPAYQLLMGFYEMEDPETGAGRPMAEIVMEYGRIGPTGAGRLALPAAHGVGTR